VALSLFFTSTPAFAADGRIKAIQKNCSRITEIRRDRRELRGNFKGLKGDRRELRGDVKSGAADTEIAQDRKEIRSASRETKGDRTN
jgi:hypothetical protein